MELKNLTKCLRLGTTYFEWDIDALFPTVSNQVVSTLCCNLKRIVVHLFVLHFP